MATRIAVIQGHPDPDKTHLCHALAGAYASGAEQAGHEVRFVEVAELNFPILRKASDFQSGEAPADIAGAQQIIGWADHLIIVYPLWLGTMPALLKAFLEQVFRPGFAMRERGGGKMWEKLLKAKSARIVVTMGMPAFFYRWYFFAHGLKNLERNILGFSGIGPIRESLFGMVEAVSDAKRRKWLAKMEVLGRKGV